MNWTAFEWTRVVLDLLADGLVIIFCAVAISFLVKK